MTRAQIFTAAHKLAKTFVGNYAACFALALREVYASLKQKIQSTMRRIPFDAFKKQNDFTGFYYGDEKETNEYFMEEFKIYLKNLVKAGKIKSYKFEGNDAITEI